MTDEQQPAGDDAATEKIEAAGTPTPAVPDAPAADAATTPWDSSRGRRIAVRSLIALATVLGILSVFATWANRQLLDTDQWTKTSSQLLENKKIRDQVALYLTDQLYANVDVTGELQSRLPGNLKLLAPAAAAGLRNLVNSAAQDALARPEVQTAWENANRFAHRQLVKIIDGGGPNVSTSNGVVTLDLQRILTSIGDQVGIPAGLLAKIPSSAANVEVFRSNDLKTAQDGAKALKDGSLILTLLVILLFALAVWLAAGHRRQTLLTVGFAFIIAGFVVLIARRIGGGQVTDSLTTTAAVRPAADAAWNIGTSLLKTLGTQAIIIGIAVIFAAWLGGPSKWATAFRRASAPYMRDRPEIPFGILAAILLVVIAWGPIPALRRPLFVLIFIAFAILGAVLLRRETEREFPDAAAGEATAGLRDRASRAGAGAKSMAAGAAAQVRARSSDRTQPAGDADEQRMAKLERLVALRDGGALSDEEFAAQKAKLLADDDA
ncbi:MAG TPA: SHOCT domain-containing protein [Solirubrobacteraceae bacterium]